MNIRRHRAPFAKPRTPQTNGMVERYNDCDAEVLATRRYDSAQDLKTTLLRYVFLQPSSTPESARSPMPHGCHETVVRKASFVH